MKIINSYPISIHALLAESDRPSRRFLTRKWISIHALLAESDIKNSVCYFFTRGISIHALLAESDRFLVSVNFLLILFLSTLSLRRATALFRRSQYNPDISIHALLAESDAFINDKDASKNISIHALLAESDYAQAKPPEESRHFYPRSPCGERQKPEERVESRSDISIHALLAESDSRNSQNINRGHKFLSTLSLRRATHETTELIINI